MVKDLTQERLLPALNWCEENKERINAQPYAWYKNNRINVNRRCREYRNKSVKNLLTARVRSLLNYSLRYQNIKKKGRLGDILGYSIKQLENRLEKTLPAGHTWQNFLNGELDIDHIKPVIAFNYNSENDPEFKRCWALSNLRLLTVKDNRSKRFNSS